MSLRISSALGLFALLALCGQAQAANPAAIPDMRLEQTDEGLFLTAALEFELPTLAEDALRLVRGVKNGPSPAWMQQRLKAIGLRPINALVDITNYFTFADAA